MKQSRLVKVCALSLLVAVSSACGAGFGAKSSKGETSANDTKDVGRPGTDGEGVPGYLTDPSLVSTTINKDNGKLTIIGSPGSVAATSPDHRPDFVLVSVVETEKAPVAEEGVATELAGKVLASDYAAEDGSFSFEVDFDPSKSVVIAVGMQVVSEIVSVETEQFVTVRTFDADAALAPLLGTWRADCANTEDSTSARSVKKVSATRVAKFDLELFGVPDCSGTPLAISTIEINFVPVGMSAEVDGAVMVDHDKAKIYDTPLSADLVAVWNANKHCGLETWVVNEPTTVTNLICDGEVKDAPMRHGIVQVVDGKLYFGDDSGAYDGSTPEKRPVALLTDVPHTKVED